MSSRPLLVDADADQPYDQVLDSPGLLEIFLSIISVSLEQLDE
jgi:hypothetical protein